MPGAVHTSRGNIMVQGLTLDEIVVDLKGGRFSPGHVVLAVPSVLGA